MNRWETWNTRDDLKRWEERVENKNAWNEPIQLRLKKKKSLNEHTNIKSEKQKLAYQVCSNLRVFLPYYTIDPCCQASAREEEKHKIVTEYEL